MTDSSTLPNDEPEFPVPETEGLDADERDLSIRKTPQEWLDAEQQSPQDSRLATKRVKMHTTATLIPRKTSSTSLFLSGLLASLVTGAAWAGAEMLGLFESAWLSVPAGVLIALIVRAGCGREDAGGRATASAIAYLITLLIVLGFLTRREIFEIYGNTADVLILEENLFRRRFSRVDQLAAYVIGWAATWYTSIWLRH